MWLDLEIDEEGEIGFRRFVWNIGIGTRNEYQESFSIFISNRIELIILFYFYCLNWFKNLIF